MSGLAPGRSALLWMLVQMGLCFGAVLLLHREGPGAALADLGLRAPIRKALEFAFLVTLPMLAILAVLARGQMQLAAPLLVTGGVAASLSQEVLHRGYLFGQLYRRAGWPFWAAIAADALLLGLGQTVQSGRIHIVLVEAAQAAVVGGLASALAAWIFIRWEGNLWVIIGIQVFSNLWWQLFAEGRELPHAAFANVARAITFGLIILLTIRRGSHRRAPRGAAA